MILIHSPAFVPVLNEHNSIIHVMMMIINEKVRVFIDNTLSAILNCDIVGKLSAKVLYTSSRLSVERKPYQILKSFTVSTWTFRIQWLTFILMRSCDSLRIWKHRKTNTCRPRLTVHWIEYIILYKPIACLKIKVLNRTSDKNEFFQTN